MVSPLLLTVLLGVACCSAVAQESGGSTVGRVKFFEGQLGTDDDSGEGGATSLRSSKLVKRWYHKESMLTPVLEAAEAAYKSNLRRRNKFIVPQDITEEESLSRYHLYSVDALYIPTYPCAMEKRIGQWVDGGKWVCFAQYWRAEDPVVLSIGSRGDTSFEEMIYKNLGVVTSTVDFSLSREVAQRVQSLDYVKLYEVGLAGTDPTYQVPERLTDVKWVNIFQLLDLVGYTYVDIFKIDCEQCERGVIADMAAKYTRENVPFGMILMEYHSPSFHLSSVRSLAMLEDLGYRLYHSEINRFDQIFEHAHYEIALIHERVVKPRTFGDA